ncbi:uncharacterized protein AB675_5884 [Cyphellophora attinorum]|uniref:Xylanolytic transcriptional activator regulatory domain-containing protein n=1 Tax=Cyphellophora attinorum TaxID=1664694 RepID=A0A0N1H2K8_9EURO|nr:uncharacterized protein AB675_5884 [Phialophora attinorum]KPI38922.1 hypothetical protein AB675_5884 [Phialophora attinorum]
MKSHTQKADDDAQKRPQLERRSTISEGVNPDPQAQTHQQQQPHRQSFVQPSSTQHQGTPGISVMQLLSPINDFATRRDANGTSHARQTSIGMPSSYIDPRPNQHRQDHITIPTDWSSSSPVTQTAQPVSQANPSRESTTQHSADVSTYETSMSGSHQPAQTPQSDLGQAGFGANAMDWLPPGNMPGTDFHDPFQMWLFPSLGDLDASPDFLQTYGVTTPAFAMPDPKLMQESQKTSQERTKNISKVPRERFSRIQKCWSSRPHRLHRLMPSLWKDIISYHVDNLFSEEHAVPIQPKAGTNWGLDADCRFRLRDTFHTPAPSAIHSPKIQSSTLDNHTFKLEDSSTFPPAEILDIAMGLFFRRFHPTVPFIHVPTFSVNNTPPPMLFVVCLIGLSILGTTGATRFVSRMFPTFIQRVANNLAACTSGAATPVQQMSHLATALLTLHLAAMTGDKDTIIQCQMLYVTTMAVAQQNGLFSACDGQDLSALILDLNESEHQWKAWSRVESAKRLILCTMTLDSWYSVLLSRSPIVRSDGRTSISPTFQISDLHTASLDPSVSLGFLGSSTLLALLQIQIYESYHRLMPVDQQQIGSLIPWQLYAADMKARSLVPALLASTSICGPQMRIHDTNTLVLWHSLNILLLADLRMFELAAGRHGATPATGALESISSWSQTTSARRAVVHAAQNFKLMHDRRVSDNVTVHSVMALFSSALILGLYLFMVPPTTNHNNRSTVELIDWDIDWAELSDTGYTTDHTSSGSPTGEASSYNQHNPSGSISSAYGGTSNPHNPDSDSLSPPAHFVKYGGTVSLSGVAHQGGYESARRVLLEFANLMDGISGRKLRVYTQVLHIMSDDLMVIDAKE